jgi:hypothetical protein
MKATAAVALLAGIFAGCHPINCITKNQQQMFTTQQISAAHSKVKSGADFPAYIREIKTLGVTYYETFVADGHIDYYGANNYKATTPPNV